MRLLGACSGLLLAGSVAAHEGHDHGADPDDDEAPSATVAAAAATATTPQVELVATREGGDLLIYIDDYASNAPIDGLHVQLREGTHVLQAAAAGDGVYRLPADLIEARGGTTVTFLLHGAALDLQVEAAMPDAPAAAKDAGHGLPGWSVLLIAAIGAVLVIAMSWSGLARRRTRTPRS